MVINDNQTNLNINTYLTVFSLKTTNYYNNI